MAQAAFAIDKNFTRKKLVVPGVTAVAFWTLAIVMYTVSGGQIFALINFG